MRADAYYIVTREKPKPEGNSEINRPVRPGSLRTWTDGSPPSVLGPDGDGAVFLNEDGDGEVTVPGSHPPSPADNGRLQNICR